MPNEISSEYIEYTVPLISDFKATHTVTLQQLLSSIYDGSYVNWNSNSWRQNCFYAGFRIFAIYSWHTTCWIGEPFQSKSGGFKWNLDVQAAYILFLSWILFSTANSSMKGWKSLWNLYGLKHQDKPKVSHISTTNTTVFNRDHST